MRFLGRLLIIAGIAVWLLGVAAWVLGVWVTLPPAAVRALVLALSTLSGGALLMTGAALSRARRATRPEAERV